MAALHLAGAVVFLTVSAAPALGVPGLPADECDSQSIALSTVSRAACRQAALGRDGCGSEVCSNEHVTLLQKSAGSRSAPAPSRKVGWARARAVFFAGLEGSGHHLMQSLTDGPDGIIEQFGVKTLGAPDDFHQAQLIPGLSCHNVLYDSEHFATLRSKFMEFEPGQVYFLPRMMSYPHCGVGGSKGHRARVESLHPHLGFIAEAAEQTGIDLHVVFLYRPLADSLIAGCVHRLLEPCEQYAKTLAANAGILARQLKRMKAAQVHCFPYGKVDDMVAALDVASGPSVHSRGSVHRIFRPVAYDKNGTSADAAQAHLSDVIAQQLEKANDALQEICQRTSEPRAD